jgi:hypothetical protein
MNDYIKTNVSDLVNVLYSRLGRVPTFDETFDFIFGSIETRTAIWNKEVKTKE